MTRVNLGKQHPDLYKGVVALSQEADTAFERSGLEPVLADLVKLRVSQINGCAYCLRLHTRDALDKGETTDRIAVVGAWWESQYFTDVERAAFALAEEVTRLPVPEPRTWDDGSLTEEQVSAVSWVAIVMNTWNRISITSHYPVAP